jgi:hypothetical protein
LAALVLLPSLLLGLKHLPSYARLHHDTSARAYAESVLLEAPPGAHILANWHWYTPLRYLQLVEGRRQDVLVSYVYPQGAAEMPQAWPARIERELAAHDRPLIVTSLYPTYLDLPYRFEPLGEAYLVRVEPTDVAPDGLTPLEARLTAGADQVRLLGFLQGQTTPLQPGEELTVDLAWQPTVPLERGYAFSVQLVGASGIPHGQQDIRHDAAPTYLPGELLVDRYRIAVLPAAAPGIYELRVSVYFTRPDGSWERMALPDGRDAVVLATVAVDPASLPPVSTHRLRRSLRGGPTLVGVDYDDTVLGTRRVYLHWRASAQPTAVRLTADGQPVAEGPVPASAQSGYVTTVFDLPAGSTDLRLSAYDGAGGGSRRWRGVWGVPVRSSLALPQPKGQQHYLSLGGKLALIRVDHRRGLLGAPPGDVRVALCFVGLQPIVSDNVVSVRIVAATGSAAQSDRVPALGAIPTYKWVRGSRVCDVHTLSLPDGVGGQGQTVVSVYDAFTGRVLPPLDERIARLGLAGVPLGTLDLP